MAKIGEEASGKRKGILKRVAMWMDLKYLWPGCHNTHPWYAKLEVLRRMRGATDKRRAK